MFKETVIEYLERDLRKLKDEMAAYKDRKTIWAIHEGIGNSGGNLCACILSVTLMASFCRRPTGKNRLCAKQGFEFADKNVTPV